MEGGDILVDSLRSPETGATVEDVFELVDAELLDGRISDLILWTGIMFEEMELELPFGLSVELMTLDEGRVTDDATDCIVETSREPFCGGRSSRGPRELALMIFSLMGTCSTTMWG
jgi:hypothetical protein